MKNKKNYIAKSTATLTQSGLLAALLQHQRRKMTELTQRHAQREQAHRLLRSSLTWLLARSHVDECVALRERESSPGTLKAFNRVTDHGPPNPHLLSSTATDPQ
jgi:hypothetical protein